MAARTNGKKGKQADGQSVEVREIVPSVDRHERFCQEYLLDLNASAAYQRTYPDASLPSCEAAASRLLGNVKVQRRITELQAERANRFHVDQDNILRELVLLGFSDVQHFTVSDQGKLELAEGAPDHAWRSVASVKHRITSGEDFTVREVEYRLWNKNNALELLGKHIGLFPNKHEHTGKNGTPISFTLNLGAAALARLHE